MSFGFGLGDVLTVSKLTLEVFNAYKDAPTNFQNISHEIESLHIILSRENDGLAKITLQTKDQEELRKILQGCEAVLKDLQNLLIKHKRLAGEGTVAKFVGRVRLGFEDISELRARLISNTNLLHLFITRCAMDKMTDLVTHGTRASTSSLASFATSFSSKAIWKKHCRDLHEAGVTTEIIRQRGTQVVAFLQSETAPVEDIGIIDSQSASTSRASTLQQNKGEISKGGAEGKDGSLGTTLGFKGALPGAMDAPSLVAAVAAGDADGVRVLLTGKVFWDLDNQVTALQTAAGYGHADIVRILLEQGVNIEAARSDTGATALDSATYAGHAEVVRLLLDQGANIEAARNDGWTALNTAASRGHGEIVRLLLEQGANIEATSDTGATALDSAAYAGHAGVVRLLLEQGANIEATRGGSGATALNTAARLGHTAIVRLLLEQGANIEATRSDNEATSLNSAAYRGHADVVRLLLEQGANIEAASNTGATALGRAAYAGHADVVKLLLEIGANIEARNYSGSTALNTAAYAGHTGVVRLLLDKGASVDTRTRTGATALLLAAKKAHRETVGLLLEKGACPHQATMKGNTALHAILRHAGHSAERRIPTISLLLDHGANILHANNKGQTPLGLAEALGFMDLKQLAIKHNQRTRISIL